jgi:nitrite reductase/ring-hydroxylating ferredoxin subunit
MNDTATDMARLNPMDDTGSQWHALATVDDVGPGEMIAREFKEVHIALYNIGGDIFATDNVCTHAYALLTDGWLDDAVVECPLHGGQFNVCTGKAICSPAEVALQTYSVRIVDGRVEVLLPS